MHPVGIEQRRRRCAIRQTEAGAGRPFARRHQAIEPDLGRVEHRVCSHRAVRIAKFRFPDEIEHELNRVLSELISYNTVTRLSRSKGKQIELTL